MANKATARKAQAGAPRNRRRAPIRRGTPLRSGVGIPGAGVPGAGKPAAGRDVEEIFERVRNAVLDQRLAPGMQLKEQQLADAFKVNRPVIRQVLARLQSCHLAVHRPNRGMFVALPSVRECADIFLARQVIEAAVVEIVAATIRPEQLAELKALVAREQAAHAQGELRAALRYSIDFHRALAQFSGNVVLGNFVEELLARTPLVVLAFKRLDLQACGLSEHSDIVAAIEARDKPRAATLMREHIRHLESLLDLEARDHAGDTGIANLFGYDAFS